MSAEGNGRSTPIPRIRFAVDALAAARPSQLAGRARRVIPPRVLALGCSSGQPAAWQPIEAELSAETAAQSEPVLAGGAGHLSALGVRRDLGVPNFWTDDRDGLLFLFHLHGFSGLGAYAIGEQSLETSEAWGRIVRDWIETCASPALPAWQPYPLSERIRAWSIAVSLVRDWPSGTRERIVSEIWRQGRFLARFPEYDVGGNHLIENGLGLVFAGAIFPGSTLGRRGAALLRRELRRQFLDDGGHEERSPSYHRRLTERLHQAEVVLGSRGIETDWIREVRERAVRWQQSLAGPDGRLPLFNDSWETPPLILEPDRPDLQELSSSGFVIARRGEDQLVIDAGPLAPRHLPPHAHADALSFQLWMDGDLVIGDPGCYLYEDPVRERLRSTWAHSTVEVDGESQCVFWGTFRAAFLPRVAFATPVVTSDATVIRTAHDGYARLADPTTHRRIFVWLQGEGLIVVDRLESEGWHQVKSSLPFPPGVALEDGRVGALSIAALGRGGYDVETRDFAPSMGSLRTASCLSSSTSFAPREPFGWSLLRTGTAELSGNRLSITRSGAVALEVDLDWSEPRL